MEAGTPVAKLTPAERDALEEFGRRTRAALGSDLIELRLFGSRARGEGDEHSDVDIAVVVTPAGRRRRRVIYDLAFDAGFERGVALAPTVIEAGRLDELRRRERLFASHLDRDGIPL